MNTDAYKPGVGFKVAAKRCDQCLYSTAKVVSDERRASILSDCSKEGTYFICHKASLRGDAVVCRGFFDEGSNLACRAAVAFGLVVEVNPATGLTEDS